MKLLTWLRPVLMFALCVLGFSPNLRADLVTPPNFTSISVPSTATLNQTVGISAAGQANYSDNSDGNDWNSGSQPTVLRIVIDYLPPGGSWTNLNDWMSSWVSPSSVSTSLTLNQAGTWYVRFQIMDGRPWYSDQPVYQIVVSPPPGPVITSALALGVNQGGYVNYTITAANSPTSFSASNLPPGLSLNSSTGHIYGNYTGSSSVNTTISASNAYGTDTKTLSWSVTPASISGAASVNPSIQTVGQSVSLAYTAYANFGIAWVEHVVFRPNGSAYVGSHTTGTSGSQTWTPDGGPGSYVYLMRVVDIYYNYQDYVAYLTVVPAPVATTTPSPSSILFGQSSTVTMSLTQASPATLGYHWMLWDQGNNSQWTGIGFAWNFPSSTTGMSSISNLSAWPTGNNSSTKSFVYTPNFVGAVQFLSWGQNSTNMTPNWSQAGLTIGKATPVVSSWPNRTLPGPRTVTAGDLSATFSNPYSAAVTAPSGAPSFSVIGLGNIAVGSVISPGTYNVRAAYAGDTNYNSTYADVSWTIQQPLPVVTSATSATATIGQLLTYQTTASNGPTSFGFTWYTTAAGAANFNAATGAFTITPSGPPGSYQFGVSAQNGTGWGATQPVNLTVYGRTPSGSVTNTTAAGATTIFFGQTLGLNWTGSAPDNNLSYVMTRLGGPATIVSQTINAPANAYSYTDSGGWGTGYTWVTPGNASSMSQSITWRPNAAGSFSTWGHVRNSDWSGTMNDGRDYNLSGPTFTVAKATPAVAFASRSTAAQTTASYTVTASDLNAIFSNPYSSGVVQPTAGAVSYRFAGTTTVVTVGTTLPVGYAYTIEAVFAGDANYNAITSSATFSVSGASAPASLAVPSGGTGSTFINLTWSAAASPVGINHYDVYRNGTLVGSSTTPAYTDASVAPSTAYTYAVKAVDNSGNSSVASNSVSPTTAVSFEIFTPSF